MAKTAKIRKVYNRNMRGPGKKYPNDEFTMMSGKGSRSGLTGKGLGQWGSAGIGKSVAGAAKARHTNINKGV